MKIKLPADLKGIKFSQVLTIEMNSFDIDIFLPSLFYTILSQGRGRARLPNDPRKIKHYVNTLAERPEVEGFTGDAGRRVLERLVRTTLITTGSVGRSQIDEQITSIVPYSLLSHKPGFPTGRYQRGVDTFIYQMLREQLGDKYLREFVESVFGRGVIIGKLAELGGSYDGTTELDTLTRLSVTFLNCFETARPGISREKDILNSCPGIAYEFATDLLRYLQAFRSTMPTQAFTHYLLVLINFELFNYTLKLVHAINQLVHDPTTLPPAMCPAEISGPSLYVDFTGQMTGRSQEMAKACVARDIEAYQQFFYSNLLLRQLHHYAEGLKKNAKRKSEVEKILRPSLSAPEYLQRLLHLQDNPLLSAHIDAAASLDEDRIYEENTHEEDADNPEALDWLRAIADAADSNVERVVQLLAEGQRSDALSKYVTWYWSVGGLKKPQGILRGTLKGRKSWRYAPTNDLLAVLVQIAAARYSVPAAPGEPEQVQPLRLQTFLQFLEERFGIIVDRPPAPFEGAEYVAAARENLRAMLSRLRQMGIFRDLSDDFTVQRLHPPYTGA
jgi:hypothetical protein